MKPRRQFSPLGIWLLVTILLVCLPTVASAATDNGEWLYTGGIGNIFDDINPIDKPLDYCLFNLFLFLIVYIILFPAWLIVSHLFDRRSARFKLSEIPVTRLYVALFVVFLVVASLRCLHGRGIPPVTLEAKFRRAVWTDTIAEKFPSTAIMNLNTVETAVVVYCKGWMIERATEPNFAGVKNWRVLDPKGKVRWWGSKEELKKKF